MLENIFGNPQNYQVPDEKPPVPNVDIGSQPNLDWSQPAQATNAELGSFLQGIGSLSQQMPGRADATPAGIAPPSQVNPWQAGEMYRPGFGGGYQGYDPGKNVEVQRGSGSAGGFGGGGFSQGNNGFGAIQAQPANPFGNAGGTDLNKILYGNSGGL